MLLTENAATAIRAITDTQELPEGAGLRIATTSDGAQELTLSAVSLPETGDQVVENEGARVFLEPGAAALLDDQVLDAQLDQEGSVKFLVSPSA